MTSPPTPTEQIRHAVASAVQFPFDVVSVEVSGNNVRLWFFASVRSRTPLSIVRGLRVALGNIRGSISSQSF